MPTFTNQAILTLNGVSYASNIITGEIINVLTVDKNAIENEYASGGRITYVVSLRNSGPSPLNNLTLSDNLGAYSFSGDTLVPLDADINSIAYYINGQLQPTGSLDVSAGPPMTIGGIDVPAGGNAQIIYQTTANSLAPLASATGITNIVTVTGEQLQTPVTDMETVVAGQSPVISITKALSPTTVPENGQITYTFQILNAGNTPVVATDDMILTDVFNPRLSNLTAVYNGTFWTEGIQYTYNEMTGEFVTLPGTISVPAATFEQNPVTGEWIVTPGSSELEVSGTV